MTMMVSVMGSKCKTAYDEPRVFVCLIRDNFGRGHDRHEGASTARARDSAVSSHGSKKTLFGALPRRPHGTHGSVG